MTLRPFHLAFPVHDLDVARTFWGQAMGAPKAAARTNGSTSTSSVIRSSPISFPG